MAKTLVLSRLAVLDERLSSKGPYLLGSRFSIADFYLCFWIAYLDRDEACQRFPAFARLYGLVRSRPIAATYLAETERAGGTYAEMMRRNPAGVKPRRRAPIRVGRRGSSQPSTWPSLTSWISLRFESTT